MNRKSKIKKSQNKSLIYFNIIVLILLIAFGIYILGAEKNSAEGADSEQSAGHAVINISGIPDSSEEGSGEESADTSGEEKEKPPLDIAELNISAKYLIAANLVDGTVMLEKNADEKCYPASLTKLITAITMMRYMPENYTFVVGSEITLIQPHSSVAWLSQGDRLDCEMMLDALMLPSGNDAAYTIAANIGRIIGGDDMTATEAVNEFVKKMNELAAEIGCEATNFANPDGYQDINHYTTASDMLRIVKYAYTIEEIMTSAGKYEATHNLLNGREVSWTNSNKYINPYSDSYISGLNGLKTGFTDEAGHCIAVTGKRNGIDFAVIVMFASGISERYADTYSVIQAIDDYYIDQAAA